MRIEISHHIIGYPNYQVTQEGRVKNIQTNFYLKNSINSRGYYRITLCHEGTMKSVLVHQLVANAFIPNPHNYKELDHIDRNILNNNFKNLRWASHGENQRNKNAYGKLKVKYITKTPAKTYRLYLKRCNLDETFPTLKEAIAHRDSLIDNRGNILDPNKKLRKKVLRTKNEMKYIEKTKQNTYRLRVQEKNIHKTFKTLKEAKDYRDKI